MVSLYLIPLRNFLGMLVEKHNVVSLTYELRSPDGNGAIVEVADRENPLVFIYGAGNMLEAFEQNLSGKKPGDTFNFDLSSDQAYGPIEPDALLDLPIENFMSDGKVAEEYLVPGTVLTMRDEQGYPVRGKVVSRTLDSVKMDFNHPMAGKTLNFQGEIIDVRKASPDEIAHGHVHGPGGHHH